MIRIPATLRIGAAWLTAVLLAGCASAPLDRTELMPAPAVFENGRFDPFADVPPEARRLDTEILFATDRDLRRALLQSRGAWRVHPRLRLDPTLRPPLA